MAFLMEHKKVTTVMAALLVAASGIRAGEKSVRVALEPVALTRWDDPCYHWVPLDGRGEGTVPFATPSGKLAFRLEEGGLIVDRDGNGRIDERDGKPQRGRLFFPVLLVLGERMFTIPIRVVTFPWGRLLGACTWTALRGRIGPYRVVVTDRNFNGRFLERGQDGIEVRAGRAAAGDGVEISQDSVLRSMISFHGKLVKVVPGSGGTELFLAPYQGGTARVILELDEHLAGASLELVHRQGLWETRVCNDTASLLPTGEYQLTGVRLSYTHVLEGKAPFTWFKLPTAFSLQSLEAPQPPRVVLREGPNRLRPGPPFTLRFALRRRGNLLQLDQVHLVGNLGVKYGLLLRGGKTRTHLDWFLEGAGGRWPLGSLYHVQGSLRGSTKRVPQAYRESEGVKVVVRFRCPVIGEVEAARFLPPAGEKQGTGKE